MTDVVVIGAGPAGLTTALALARAGATVTVVEQDGAEPPARAADAFGTWERRGVPQLRHSHAFLARLRQVLLQRAPDILDDLLANGATELRFADHIPATISDRSAQPGDDELVGLACRRATFEWVLWRAARDQTGLTFRTGTPVRSLVATSTPVPRITGVLLDDGEVNAGLVVDATGRNSPLPRWLQQAGARDLEEEHRDVGLLYYSRFYRFVDKSTEPGFSGQIGGDLGFLKFGIFPGDDGTFSVTMGIDIGDEEMRGIRRPQVFDALAAMLPTTSTWIAAGVAPITDEVAVMARMRNRVRRLVIDDDPIVTGLLGVGDAAVCTNPLYGRGTSLALAHGFSVADLIGSTPDPASLAVAVDELTRAELEPWYRASVAQDGMTPDHPAAALQGALFSVVRTDAHVWRSFVRTFNLLAPPEAMISDPVVQGKVMEAAANGESTPSTLFDGPSRDEVTAIIHGRAA